jgi:cobalt-zinc-cadmium efflux system protein
MTKHHHHDHDHDHKDHSHDHHSHGALGHSHGASAPHHVLIVAIVLILGFSVFEALGGWFANSLALLGDAGHMASDALALLIAAFAAWISLRPPSAKHSYGLGRAEIVAAWISSFLMIIISIAVIIEAINRINAPIQVHGGLVIIIAFVGLVVNLFVAWLLARGERTLNIRAALLHVMGDVLGSLAALISGAVIYYTGWFPIDPILSIFIGILILISSLRLLRESLLILMEGVPGHIEMDEVANKMQEISGVNGVHDLHIWTLSSGNVALSAHVDINELSSWETVLRGLMKMLKEEFGIDHVTLQPEAEIIDCQPCVDVTKT